MKNVYKAILSYCIAGAGLLLLAVPASAQMKIGANPTKINKSSILELESDRQGLLLPRLSSFIDINNIINSETKSDLKGMLVFYTGAETGYEGPGLYCYEETSTGVFNWVKIASASDAAKNWSLSGNEATSNDFLGTTNNQPLVIKTDNTERLQVTAGGAIKVASGTIGNGTTEVNVLVLKADGTILQRALPASAFTSVVKSLNGLTDDITIAPNVDAAKNTFTVDVDAANNKIILNAPLLDASNTNQEYGFLSKTDWQKLQELTDGNHFTVADAITAAAGTTLTQGAKIEYNNTTNTYTLTLIKADQDHAGIVTTEAQTFGGEKTFNNKVIAEDQLAVGGVASLNNVTVGGTLDVTGATTLTGATTIGSTLNAANLGTDATATDVLVKDGSGNIKTRTLNANAYKSLQFNNSGTDLTVDETTDPNKILLKVPDAGVGTRGVVNTVAQSFEGVKTFNNDLNVGISGTPANLNVTGTTTIGGALEVTGVTTLNNTLDVKDNTTLEKTLTLTTAPATAATATSYNVLVHNATTGNVEQTIMSADAGKELDLGTDATNKDLYLKKEADKITIEVPDATADTRGVVNHDAQTFGGEKTFANNTTIGEDASDPAKTANLTVNGGVAMATKEISSGTTALSGNNAKVRTLLVNASGGPVTITLPTGADLISGMVYTIKIITNPSMNDVTISGPNEDGTSSIVFWNEGSSRTVQYNSTESKWYIISQ